MLNNGIVEEGDLCNAINQLNDTFPELNNDIRSLYYSIDEVRNLNTNSDKDLKLIHLNARSLYPKVSEISSLLHEININFDCLCFCETWLNDSTTKLVDFDGYTPCHVTRANQKRGGGVSVFVRDCYKCEIIDQLSFCSNHIESLFVSIEGGRKKLAVGVIYRPPSGSVDQFLTEIDNMLRILRMRSFQSLQICGDFNLDLLTIDNNPNSLNFINTMFLRYLSPTISKPTRVNDNSFSLLDNIFSDNTSNLIAGIVPIDISDHYLIFNINREFFIDTNFKHGKEINHRLHTNNSIENFVNSIFNHDFSAINSCTDVDEGISMFDSTIMHFYNSHCPIIRRTVSYKDFVKPWIDLETKKKIKTRANYYILFKSGKMSRTVYNRYRNMVTAVIRDKRKSYYEQKFSDFKTDMRKTWKLINEIISPHSKNKSCKFSLTDDNGSELTDPLDIANKFNNHFSSVGQRISESFINHTGNHADYLLGNHVNSMYFSPVSPNHINIIVNQLKNKSCDVHSLPVKLFKKLSNKVSPVLASLINNSLVLGKFPTKLKFANVIPLHKSGTKQCVNNYRPISLLSTYSKIYEKVVYGQLMEYFETNNIFYKHQYGFRQNKSTTQAILNLVSDIYSSLDDNDLYFSMFLDLRKAFDSVSHSILLDKLSHYGVRGIPLSWFHSYLSERKQSVIFDNISSEVRTVTCGVPQGSVLAGLLFLIFFNDFNNCTTFFKFNLFADDSTLSIRFPRECLSTVNIDINSNLCNVYEWLSSNKIMLNAEKTKYIVFSYRGNFVLGPVMMNGCSIDPVNEIKFLGLTLDKNLTFESHVNKMTTSLHTEK